jgi:hypothetical protein
MFAEAFHSTVKRIHLALEVKIEKRRNLHTKNYKAKLERLRSARLTRRDQAARLLDMQRL